MYSRCPQLTAKRQLKATPADLFLAFIYYVKSSTKQESTHSLKYCG